MWPFLGGLVSGASSFLSGLFGNQQKKEQQYWNNIAAVNQQIAAERAAVAQRDWQAQQIAAANAQAAAYRQQDIALQREFASTGIQMRARDAVAAGIHPVFALGGGGAAYNAPAMNIQTPTASGIPQGGGPLLSQYAGNAMAGLGNMGQDLSRALMATMTQAQRDVAFDQTARDLQLANMTLKNELLSSQIAKLKSQTGPGLPDKGVVLGQDDETDRTQLFISGERLKTEPGTSDTQKFADRYGEGADWIFGPYIMWKDFNYRQTLDPPSRDLGRMRFPDFSKVQPYFTDRPIQGGSVGGF